MLVPSSHSQILVSKYQCYGMDVRAMHAHPACCGVPQIVELLKEGRNIRTVGDGLFAQAL
jgi:hypothetical protein